VKEEVPVVVVVGLNGSSTVVLLVVAEGESSKEMVSKPTGPTVIGDEPRSEPAKENDVADTGRPTTTLPNTQQAFSTAVSESLWVLRVLSVVCVDGII